MDKINEFEEIKKTIIKYIEENDYNKATSKSGNLVNNMKDEYIGYLLNEVGIKNQDVIIYAIEKFEDIAREIQQMLKERNQKHIETKTDIIKNEYHKNEEEPEMIKQNAISAEEQIEETKTQIDYEERTKQIILDEINNAINQTARTLEYIGINQNKIDEIIDAIYEKRNELFKYSGKISETLIDLDKEIALFVQKINTEYINEMLDKKENKEKNSTESEFSDSLKVPNSNNQIEEKAVENITKGLENKIDSLNPNGIFDVDEKKSTNQSKSNRLDARDIF